MCHRCYSSLVVLNKGAPRMGPPFSPSEAPSAADFLFSSMPISVPSAVYYASFRGPWKTAILPSGYLCTLYPCFDIMHPINIGRNLQFHFLKRYTVVVTHYPLMLFTEYIFEVTSYVGNKGRTFLHGRLYKFLIKSRKIYFFRYEPVRKIFT